jgi:ATP-binding cassette subfamily C (CFTR/MRP) protein 1
LSIFRPYRWDFTPCFIDVWIASVSVFGIVFGAIALWWLLAKQAQQYSTAKNTHFWIKQVSCRNPP